MPDASAAGVPSTKTKEGNVMNTDCMGHGRFIIAGIVPPQEQAITRERIRPGGVITGGKQQPPLP